MGARRGEENEARHRQEKREVLLAKTVGPAKTSDESRSEDEISAINAKAPPIDAAMFPTNIVLLLKYTLED
ncbi:unnamed protein product, partial [Ascophyllum nodosum]